MPEMRFRVRWPDGAVRSCYSPSLIVKEYLAVGGRYVVGDFVARSEESLTIASDRVRQKFGFHCSAAGAQLDAIKREAERYADDPTAEVVVEGFEE